MKTYTFHVSLPGYGRVWRKLELAADQTLEDLHFAIQDAFDFDSDHLYSFFMSGRAWDMGSEYCLPEGVDPWGDEFDFDEQDEADEATDDAEPEEPPTPQDLRSMFDALNTDKTLRAELTENMLDEFGIPRFLADRLIDDLSAFIEATSDADLSDFVRGIDDLDQAQGDVRTTTLESLGLKKSKSFLYLFDYGDEWRFKVRVHAINATAPEGVPYPRLVEEVGEAPSQYGDWEDDEEWDEE